MPTNYDDFVAGEILQGRSIDFAVGEWLAVTGTSKEFQLSRGVRVGLHNAGVDFAELRKGFNYRMEVLSAMKDYALFFGGDVHNCERNKTEMRKETTR